MKRAVCPNVRDVHGSRKLVRAGKRLRGWLGFAFAEISWELRSRANGTRESKCRSAVARACSPDLERGQANPSADAPDSPRCVQSLRLGWRWRPRLDPRLPLRSCNSRGFHNPRTHRRNRRERALDPLHCVRRRSPVQVHEGNHKIRHERGRRHLHCDFQGGIRHR